MAKKAAKKVAKKVLTKEEKELRSIAKKAEANQKKFEKKMEKFQKNAEAFGSEIEAIAKKHGVKLMGVCYDEKAGAFFNMHTGIKNQLESTAMRHEVVNSYKL